MLNRRSFARHATLLGGAAALSPVSAFAQEETSSGALPPAIAALPNRRSEAKPITLAERKDRFERARQLMAQNKLDAICLIGGTSLMYFTGVRWGNSERLFAFVLPKSGHPFYVTPHFEQDRAQEQISGAPEGDESRVLTWQEDDDPYALVARGLRDAGVSSGRIGIEERVIFVFSDGIAKANPGVEIVSATPVTAGCRMIKSPAELALQRLASHVTLDVYEAVWKSLQPGMVQADFRRLIGQAYRQSGFPGEASINIGEYSALPHGSIKPQAIREGTIVLIDDGCTAEGYQSDISRTFVLGKASDKMKHVFDVVHRAQAAALKAARPGLPCGEVDAAARKVIADAGFGENYDHFTHRVGHGMGMDGHEWPYLVHGNRLPLAANMTFSDEPGIYIRGEFGVRLEDDIHITEDGAEMFTPQSPSLEEPFARA
jgi:Xaa-Pro aminopeptidase